MDSTTFGSNNNMMSKTTARAHYLSTHLRQIGGIPVKIEASTETLKEELPHHSWMSDFQYVVEGRQVGYAVRETGDDLIYVKFPIVRDSTSIHPSLLPPASVHLIGFTLPKRYLIPVSLPQDGSVPNADNSPKYKTGGGSTTNGGFATATTAGSGGGGNESYIISTLLSQSLAQKPSRDGKSLLCVVCGAWNTEGGQVRKSGFKCKNCIGVKSVARLKEAYQKLMQSEPEE